MLLLCSICRNITARKKDKKFVGSRTRLELSDDRLLANGIRPVYKNKQRKKEKRKRGETARRPDKPGARPDILKRIEVDWK